MTNTIMLYPALVTIIALFIYSWIFFNVGRARGRTGIKAPAVTGSDEFERYYRVQMNTVEQMALFLPAMWLCANFFSPVFATWLGIVWCIGRILYALGYYKDAKKRGPGFGLTLLASIVLVLGASWGIGVKLLAG